MEVKASHLHCLTDYDPKILLAFGESLKGDKKFTDFLMQNGFPELGALSAAIHSSTDALDWLLKNGYPEFAVLSHAIDSENEAIAWLLKYNCHFLSVFAAACRKEEKAIKWFVDNQQELFISIIKTIHKELLFQSWDSSDVHRRRVT